MKIPAVGRSAQREQPDLAKNVFWMVISRFGAQGLMVLFTLVLAHRLGSAEFGAYAFMAAMIFVGNALTAFGTDMLLIREIASRNDLSQLLPALVIQLALSGGFIALTWAAAPLLPHQSPSTVLGLKIYSLALLPLAFFGVFTAALRGMQRMESYMALNLAVSALQLAVVWALVRPGSSMTQLAGWLLLVQCAGAVLGGVLCARQMLGFWKGWHFSWSKTVALVRLSAPIALIALIGILYQKISIYMVSTLVGPAPTGWFSAALRVMEASKTIHLAVFTALYPAMAQISTVLPLVGQAGAPWKMPWQGAFNRSWKLLLAGAAAASLLLLIFAGPIIQILYGAEYAPAAEGLQLISCVLIPFTVNTFFALDNLAGRRERAVMRVQLVGLLTLAALNAWWIPIWGAAGACLAFLLAETTQAVLYLSSSLAFRQNTPLKVAAAWNKSGRRGETEDPARTGDSA